MKPTQYELEMRWLRRRVRLLRLGLFALALGSCLALYAFTR